MVAYTRDSLRVAMFIPLLELAQSSLDDALMLTLVALLAILLFREILRQIAVRTATRTLWPPLLLVAFTAVALLLIKILVLPG